MKKATIAGLLIIAIADNISDTLSLHIYKEAEGAKRSEISSATYGNYITRLVIVISFILVVLLLPATLALIVSSVWGLTLLVFLSIAIASVKHSRLSAEIIWHVIVAVFVILICNLLGALIYGRL